jgi:hypothetical protein
MVVATCQDNIQPVRRRDGIETRCIKLERIRTQVFEGTGSWRAGGYQKDNGKTIGPACGTATSAFSFLCYFQSNKITVVRYLIYQHHSSRTCCKVQSSASVFCYKQPIIFYLASASLATGMEFERVCLPQKRPGQH